MTPPETPTTTTTFRYLVLTIVPKKCNLGSERKNGLGRKRQKMDWGVGQACCCRWWWWVWSVNHPVKLFGWLRTSLHHYKRQNEGERQRDRGFWVSTTDWQSTNEEHEWEWLASNNTCELQMGDTRAWKYPMKGIGCCELQMGGYKSLEISNERDWLLRAADGGYKSLEISDERDWLLRAADGGYKELGNI